MMVRRKELLEIAENGSASDLENFVKQCKSESNACISETLASCSRKQLETLWEKLLAMVHRMNSQPDLEDGVDHNNLQEFVPCVTTLMLAMVSQKDTSHLHVPEYMVQTAFLLQEILPKLPVEADHAWNGAAHVFEIWWKKNLPNRDSFIMTSFVFLLQRTLELKPKPLVQDLKRVWSLHEVVHLVDFGNKSSTDFLNLVQRCFISPLYVNHDEGIKFLSFVMTLDESFTAQIHKTIKNNLLLVPRFWCDKFGEVYFRAWQGLAAQPLERFEQLCIQDLMFNAIHARPSLAPALKKLLGYIHGQKKQKGVDDMLCRLYGPIMWRSLRVANSQVRANAASLFFDAFPLQGSDLNVQGADSFLQKQFDFFQELLDDPYPHIRSLSVLGVFNVMRTYWEVIPQETLKNLMVKLLQDMLNDASSADVRESVITGINMLLDNSLCHLFMKPLLSEIRGSFHDVSERVRIQMMNLLNKVKTLRTIKYWHIVPVEHLLARLVVDSEPVNRRIMKLIFTSFVPLDAEAHVKLTRCVMLIESNPAAARQFFRYAPQHMGLNDTVNYMTVLCKAVLSAIKRSGVTAHNNSQDESMSNQNDPEASSVDGSIADDDNDDENDDDEDIVITNKPLMLSLCEVMCIMWTVSEDQLKKASNAQLKKCLQKKFSYALPEMIKAFPDNDIVQVMLQIAVHLPPSFIPTLSRSWLPKLRKLTSVSTEEEYGTLLETVCKSGRAADVIEMALDWLKPFLVESEEEPVRKIGKKKRVGFVEQSAPEPRLGVNMLTYILGHAIIQDITLDHIQHNNCVKETLRLVMPKIQAVLQQVETIEQQELTIVVDTFSLYCKLCIQLHAHNRQEHNCTADYTDILSWADKFVVPVLGIKFETDDGQPDNRRKLAYQVLEGVLVAANNMFLIGIGQSLGNTLVDFCTACLAVDDDLQLLPSVMLCLYQITELGKYSPEPDTENWCNTLSTALSRILVSIAGYVKQHPTDSSKMLSSVKGQVSQLITVFGGQSGNESSLRDVMSTVIVAVLAEMAYFSQQLELEDEAHINALPPLSCWLVDILVKKPNIVPHFVDELTECCDSGTITDLYKMHGTVHLLSALSSCKCKIQGLKELWTVLHTQTDKQLAEITEDDKDELKPVVMSVESKMKACQTALGMVPP